MIFSNSNTNGVNVDFCKRQLQELRFHLPLEVVVFLLLKHLKPSSNCATGYWEELHKSSLVYASTDNFFKQKQNFSQATTYCSLHIASVVIPVGDAESI